MIYFSHPYSDYNTKLEARLEQYIRDFFDEDVENPNKPEHSIGYQKQGMDYFIKLCEGLDSVVFMRMPNGKVGAGVAKEIESFFRQGKPVYELNRDTLEIDHIEKMPSEIMTIEETRKEIKKILQNRG